MSDTPVLSETPDPTSQFLNCRDWRSFLTAVQCAVAYPKVIDTLRASPAWFADSAARTSNWLLSRGMASHQP
jgi:hypothetical protein